MLLSARIEDRIEGDKIAALNRSGQPLPAASEHLARLYRSLVFHTLPKAVDALLERPADRRQGLTIKYAALTYHALIAVCEWVHGHGTLEQRQVKRQHLPGQLAVLE
jgi:hypothetical protein